MKKKLVFLTGTRADFGKLKSLIEILIPCEDFEVHIFATGMHMDEKYGMTVKEIQKCGYKNIHTFANHNGEALMDITLSKTIEGFANYVHNLQPDLIVVHGDRIEALAGAVVGALNNILVAHIEGGEVSGTVDELIRHAVSKLSHTHFVSNEDAKKRLLQMGETESSVFVIGSPDMDVMLSQHLPSIGDAKKRYDIAFENYAISLFHPVTTEIESLQLHAADYFAALKNSGLNYIIIYPNNDMGSEIIMQKINALRTEKNFKIFPSLRFEYFLSLLKNAQFIIGNSSAGIREAPYYGVPTINVGNRQHRRSDNPDIINTANSSSAIENNIRKAVSFKIAPRRLFGQGGSDLKFLEIISEKKFWKIGKQKIFSDQTTEI
jgi:UDP-N-acetylglucosamine 2-epimerase (hydrolysing)